MSSAVHVTAADTFLELIAEEEEDGVDIVSSPFDNHTGQHAGNPKIDNYRVYNITDSI